MQKNAMPAEALREGGAPCSWPAHGSNNYLTKMLLVMRLTIILLTVAVVHVSGNGLSQTVSFKGRNASLQEVFAVIKKQTGFTAVYNEVLLNKANPVSLDVRNLPLRSFLEQVFDNQPLEFSIKNTTIVVSRKDVEVAPVGASFDIVPPFPIRGKIMSADGTPLSGASVRIKNAKTSGMTNADGVFSLNVSVGDVLLVSYVGFDPVEYKITPAMQNIPATDFAFSAVLKRSESKLDEMQVIAYGSASRRFSVGSVSTVTSEVIERQPVTNGLLALQGQVPGLTLTPTTGAPGSAVKLQIRGQNTLAANQYSAGSPLTRPFDQPLFIIDGVPTATQNKSLGMLFTYGIGAQQTTNTPGNGISPFANLNPADIESITVLRDADATSIYGSKGANGVILITTKRGKPGKPSLNVRANAGFTAGTRRLKMLNTEQYLAYRREALANDGIVLTPTTNVNNYPDLLLFDSTRYTDWYEEFFDKTPVTTDVHVSFSGGQQYSTFILSGGYTHTPYAFAGDFNDDRISLHTGYTYRSPNNKLNLQFTTDYSYNKNNAAATPEVTAAMRMPPNFPALVDENNNLVWYYKGYELSNYNQHASLRRPADLQAHNLNSSIRLSYEILPGLSVSGNVGFNRTNTASFSAIPIATLDPKFANRVKASFGASVFHALNVEPQLDYKRVIGKGELSLLVGGTYRKDNSYSSTIDASGQVNDDLLRSLSAATSIIAYNSSTLNKYVGGYARAGYIHNRKYILSLTGRRDGSTNFGPDRRWGTFGSAGVGWIFSEEAFWPKESLSFVSFGKLSGNFGTNGSDAVAAYQYQAYYEVEPSSTTLPYQGIRAYTPTNLYNPDYSWAMKKSWNVSLDLGFLNNRVLANFTWYKNSTSNQLVAYTLPSQTGFTSVTGNFPATVQNGGLELSITSTNVQNKNFRWTSNFNISGNRNKLAAFPGLAKSPYATSYVIGESTNILQGYRYAGLDRNTGLFTFYTGKGEVTSSPGYSHISQGSDIAPLFSLDPTFGGGLGNNLTYKAVTLSLFFQFSRQMGRSWIGGLYGFGQPGSYATGNVPVEALDHWRKPGDNSELQRISSGSGSSAATLTTRAAQAFANSSGAYTDASYVRLKTVSLSWALPAPLVKKAGMTSCSIFCNAQNLFTITGYKVGDPEMAGTIYALPMQRMMVAGFSANF